MKTDEVRYWLRCGSRTPLHDNKKCHEARRGHPEHVRFGTATEHSVWQKGGKKK